MTIARLIDRIRAEFVEMPGLELTPAQAARLWNLGMDDCRMVIEALTRAGFLRWTAAQTVVRTGRDLVVACDAETDKSVSSSRPQAPGRAGGLMPYRTLEACHVTAHDREGPC